MIGKRVDYHGSLDDAWGRYVVAEEADTDDRPRYVLTTYTGEPALRRVRRESFTPVPDGPRHEVRGAALRALVAQREFGRKHPPGSVLPYVTEANDTLPGRIADLIDRKRPVEAEYWLLQAECAAGCISAQVFQDRVEAPIIAGDDESWMP